MGLTDQREKEQYFERIKNLPFVVESVDFPGNTFIDVQHLGGQVIIRLNTRHRFYREMWEPIREMARRSAEPYLAMRPFASRGVPLKH
jgi:hypothetical protein